MKRRWKWLLVVIGIVAFLCFARSQIETLGDRKHIAAQLQSWRQNVAQNPNDTESLEKMVAILNGRWGFASMYACTTLRELGPLARSAIPDLIRALNCGNGFVEREAARALGTVSVDDAAAVPALIEKMRNEQRDSAWFSAESLGQIGTPAIPAIDALEKASHSQYSLMADSAQQSLKRLRSLQRQEQ